MTTPQLEQHATRTAFFIPGFVIASWAPLVPYAKARLELDDATLGTLLFCIGLGSLLAMPMSGALAARRGCRFVMVTAAAFMLAMLPLLALASTPPMLGIVLFVLGGAIGAMDCAMNIQAVAVERDAGRSMMSGFHAFYSVGSLVGAALMTLLLGAGLAATTAIVVAIAIAGVAAALAQSAWRSERASSGGPTFALPRGLPLLIGAVCFVVFLAEGAMLDWSAVFLHEVRQIDVAHAGWGFVAFNLAMTGMRLVGDRIVDRIGRAPAVLAGGLIAGGGLALATLAPSLPMILCGYALVGIGCANVVPVMFTLAGRQTAMPESLAIAAVTTMGYAGVLAGPALIGFIADVWSLPTALLLVALMLSAAAMLGARLASAGWSSSG